MTIEVGTINPFTAPRTVSVLPTDNVVATLLSRSAVAPDHGALAYRNGDAFMTVDTASFVAEVMEVAVVSVAFGLSPGTRISLISAKRWEFTAVNCAIWTSGCAEVTIYETSSADQVEWIVGDSGSKVIICETESSLLRSRYAGRMPPIGTGPLSRGSASRGSAAAGYGEQTSQTRRRAKRALPGASVMTDQPSPLAVAWSIARARRVRRPRPAGNRRVRSDDYAEVLAALRANGVGILSEERFVLSGFRNQMEDVDPDALARDGSLAFWLNLYNAGALALTAEALEAGELAVLRVPGHSTRRGRWSAVNHCRSMTSSTGRSGDSGIRESMLPSCADRCRVRRCGTNRSTTTSQSNSTIRCGHSSPQAARPSIEMPEPSACRGSSFGTAETSSDRGECRRGYLPDVAPWPVPLPAGCRPIAPVGCSLLSPPSSSRPTTGVWPVR